MGIGMGMLEETVYDPRTGHPINNNFADYMVAVNADVPELDCIFLDYPDPVLNEYGARGIGEIGLTGCASALTMATYHATGVRIRELHPDRKTYGRIDLADDSTCPVHSQCTVILPANTICALDRATSISNSDGSTVQA